MRRLRPAAAGFALLLLAAGCQLTGGSAAGSGSPVSVNVAAVPGVDTAPLYAAARANGLFARYGVTVRITNYSTNQQALAALGHGADIAATDYGQIFTAEVANPNLVIVADGYDARPGVLEIVTLPDSGITTPAKLAGLKIGVPASQLIPGTNATQPDSLATAAAQSVLTGLGVNLANITWDPLPPSQETSALQKHQVKAILVGEPQLFQAQAQLGAVAVLDAFSNATSNLPLTGYVTTRSDARNPRLAAAISGFRTALQLAEINANSPGPVQSVLPHLPLIPQGAPISPQEAALVTLGTYPGSTVRANVLRVPHQLYLVGMLPQKIPGINTMFPAFGKG